MKIYKDNAMYYTAEALVRLIRTYEDSDVAIIDPNNYWAMSGAETTVRANHNVFRPSDLKDEELLEIMSYAHGGYILKAERETVVDVFGFDKKDEIHEIEVINVKE